MKNNNIDNLYTLETLKNGDLRYIFKNKYTIYAFVEEDHLVVEITFPKAIDNVKGLTFARKVDDKFDIGFWINASVEFIATTPNLTPSFIDEYFLDDNWEVV